MNRPLAIDLFCGLGGWTDGLLAEGYDVIGFDIERHEYGEHRYPAQLVVQDVLTLHGSQFKDAALIVASPPCQKYSYMAMPWKLAKAQAAAIRADESGKKLEELNRLFNACFRIQREACEAAGRHIPMIVENVRGAEPWVGRSRWNYGSFYLWGDIPALMPPTLKARKVPGFRFDGSGKSFQSASVEHTGVKVSGMNWSGFGKPDYVAKGFNTTADQRLRDAVKVPSAEGRRTDIGKGARFTSRDCGLEGRKGGGDWFGSGDNASLQRRHGSKSSGRKHAAAMIAKIPLPLSRYIAGTFRPQAAQAAE